MTTRIKTILYGLFILFLLMLALWESFKWGVMRVFVPPDKALVITNKFGQALPPDRITVSAGESRYKGVREEILGPGLDSPDADADIAAIGQEDDGQVHAGPAEQADDVRDGSVRGRRVDDDAACAVAIRYLAEDLVGAAIGPCPIAAGPEHAVDTGLGCGVTVDDMHES